MNLKILLVEPNESIGDLIVKNLEQEFAATVTSYRKAAEALTEIKKGSYDLFVVRNNSQETVDGPAEVIAALFLNAIYDNALKTPLIVIGDFEHVLKKHAFISDRLRIEELNRLVLKALNLKKEDFDYLRLPDYLPYSIKYFYLMSRSPCDIFIKLSKKSGEEFVRKLVPGEGFNREDLRRYEDLGLQEFFILKGDRDLFMNGMLNQSLKTLWAPHPPEEAIEMAGDSFTLSGDLIKAMGITPACVAMVNQTVQNIRAQIAKSDKLAVLFKKLLDDHLSYSYRRSYLICLLSHTLLPKMEWGIGDQQANLLEKLSMVSFFHDIYLEDDKLLKIMGNEALKNANLSLKERELVLNHANKAVLLVQGYPHLAQGVDTIIKQHHGVFSGVGFPENLTAAISPMAIFFIVIEDFATQILEHGNLARINDILKALKETYKLMSYKKVVMEIETMFTKK